MTLINLSGFARGVTSDETSVNIESFEVTVEPEYKEILPNKTNEARGVAVGAMKKTVTMSGEIGGASGIMAASATSSFSPANSTSYFGAPSTGLYLDTATVTENRADWKKFTATLTAYAGIA